MLLVWSGGCDSTLLLHDLVKDSTKNKPVRTISVMHPQIGAMKEQRAARKKVLRWMKKNGHHVHHHEVEVKHTEEKILCSGSRTAQLGINAGDGITQYMIWISCAMSYLLAKEDLYMGYIKGDDAWWYRGEIYQSFKHQICIMGKEGEIKFPLARYSKAEVISRLKKAGLYDLTWYCESPNKKGEPCEGCDPCIKHDSSLYELRQKEIRRKQESKIKAKSKKKAAKNK